MGRVKQGCADCGLRIADLTQEEDFSGLRIADWQGFNKEGSIPDCELERDAGISAGNVTD